MTTSLLSRMQIDRDLRRSTEHVEIVPQETCVHHESPDSVLTECATMSTSTHVMPNSSSTISKSATVVSPRRASEIPGTSVPNK
ncbi:uncharacterized protein CELE_C45G9.8 [Caenorhabditis elegans]|uniref:Uncharacterized protein n=1 Tax=Caenorhabditis elegans TaxID=6239 RepID=UPI00015E505B|nr:Uncharacterized protein CELE_C45G9.8 [Caenorhabditis elegans]CCD67405.1 Uncharacterized protein CELE_C45G9.8 [Caenorhabditis elegans]|eukprot:NP_498073.2 Uncharacterized protein CELE_C45G9.8 [Caenorhabditis elegans]